MAKLLYFLLPLLFLFLLSCQDDEEVTKQEQSVSINGYVQKGPFINGTAITASELSDQLTTTGKNFTTQIIDNKGSFSLKDVELASRYVQLQAQGFYFDEVEGEKSAAQLTLFALANVSDVSSVNVNLLSHLEKDRVTYLMQEEDQNFEAAKQQAQQEILAIFGIEKTNMTASERLDISQDGEDNAILLAISAILQANNSVAELSELLANLITDIREDGTLDSETTAGKLRRQAMSLDLPAIRQHLEARYEELGVSAIIPNFEQYVDSDGDGFLNKDEDDTPDDFTFEAQVDVAIDTLVVSNEVTISGLKDGGMSVAKIEGGTLLINDQEVLDNSTQVSNGDKVKLLLRSSLEYAKPSIAKLSINTLIRQFSVTTDDYTPDDFNFLFIENAQRDSLYTSETITLTGLPHATPIHLEGGTLLINGQVVAGNQTNVRDGDAIAIRISSDSTYETEVVANLEVGTVSKAFTIKTRLNPWQRKAGVSGRIYHSLIVNDELIALQPSYSKVWRYSFNKSKWQAITTTFPDEFDHQRGGSVSFVIGNKAYYGLGNHYDPDTANNVTHRDLWEYDLASNTWTRKADFPGNNLVGAVSFSINGKGYVGTGMNANYSERLEPNYNREDVYHFTNEFWEYSPITDQWIRKADFPGELRNDATGFVIEGSGYIVAGNSSPYGTPTHASDMYQYNPTTNQWTQAVEVLNPQYVGKARSCVIDRKAYVSFHEDMYKFQTYDPSSSSWRLLENDVFLDYLNPDSGFMTSSFDGRIYIEYYDINKNLTQLWEFTPPQE